MKKENHPIYWFVINLALLVGSMFMTWSDIIIFDPPGFPISGWEFIFLKLSSSIEEFRDLSFHWFWFLDLLEGMGGAFIIGYIIFVIIKIVKRKIFAGSKTRSIVLAVIAISLLLIGLTLKTYLGYWLFIVGIFSSAILEWQYFKVPVNLLTGKRTRKR
jgi:hypothetical protein